jgi:hypothetical protein
MSKINMYSFVSRIKMCCNIHDAVPYLDRLEHIVSKPGFENTLKAVAMDAGYFTTHICKELHETNIFALSNHRAKLCGCQRALRASLLPFPRAGESAGASDADRHQPEHKGDRQYPGQEGGLKRVIFLLLERLTAKSE